MQLLQQILLALTRLPDHFLTLMVNLCFIFSEKNLNQSMPDGSFLDSVRLFSWSLMHWLLLFVFRRR
ncbi:hypothetical protein Hdeb2414_s0028g00704231 [Helianthus debilis subsp. tardiflorus]